MNTNREKFGLVDRAALGKGRKMSRSFVTAISLACLPFGWISGIIGPIGRSAAHFGQRTLRWSAHMANPAGSRKWS
jgi:hypothetical protein